jgi:cytochrome P450
MGFGMYFPVVSLILMRNLTGNEHKKQRKLIDPIFSAARIAKLTPLFYQVANQVSLELLNPLVAEPFWFRFAAANILGSGDLASRIHS